jgi:sortase A
MLTAGLLLVFFAAYAVYGKAWQIDSAQHGLGTELDRRWALHVERPVPGQPMARIHIPKLDRKWAVVEGVTHSDLSKGPGHYPHTAQPGQIGNVGIAGHRISSVFWDIDKLHEGDVIVAETRTGWFVYRVDRQRLVRPDQVEVIAPDPGRPGRAPVKAMLTLTTCNPKFQNWQRLIIHAELVREQAKSRGRPAELKGHP